MRAVVILVLLVALLPWASAEQFDPEITDGAWDPEYAPLASARVPLPAVDLLWMDITSNATHMEFTFRVMDIDFGQSYIQPQSLAFWSIFANERGERVDVSAYFIKGYGWNTQVWCRAGTVTTCLEDLDPPVISISEDTLQIAAPRSVVGSQADEPWAYTSMVYPDGVDLKPNVVISDRAGPGRSHVAP